MYDYVVIGAGIIGSCIARELSKYNVNALVLEKENDVANVQTLANSAIIHSGHNPEPNSLKARLSVWGNQLYEEMERELSIPLLRTGAYVVAHNKSEEDQLDELVKTSKLNKVPEFEILDFNDAVKSEPNLSTSTTKVLSLPTTKVTYPWEVAFACMENAILNGVEFRKNAEVTNITKDKELFNLTINGTDIIQAKAIINATGVNVDDISRMVESKVEYTIKPRRGEYFVLDKRVVGFVNHVLYPLPTELGKGVLLTPQVHGNILVGPDSKFVDDKHRTDNTFEGLGYVKEHAKALADNIPFHQIIRSFAGIRASSDQEDFIIKESNEVKNFFHVAGIDSPGLTAAPAIAKYLLHDVINVQDQFELNETFNPIRFKPAEFHTLSFQEQQDLVKENPMYGSLSVSVN